MKLAPLSRAPRKRSETRDIVHPILRALNRLPGVRVVRNHNVGSVVPYAHRLDPNPPRFVAGLGLGSADVVGIVKVREDYKTRPHPGCRLTCFCCLGRVFCLEVKLPASDGKPAGRLQPDQKRWIDSVRRLGGYAAVVYSVEEAVAAVDSCRRGCSGEEPW